MEWDDDIQLVLGRTEDQKKANEEYERPNEDWRPCRQEYLIFASLSLISLMVALDSSILVPALPVSFTSLRFILASITRWALRYTMSLEICFC